MMEMPDGDYCYELFVFREGKTCPELDDSITKEPKCMKYNRCLSWSISGRIMKCRECQQTVEEGVAHVVPQK